MAPRKPALAKIPPAKKPAVKKAPVEDDEEHLDFQWAVSPTPVYANFVMLTDINDIWSFAFAEIRPEAKVRKKRGKDYVPAHIVASVRMPPSAMPEAMEEIVNAWNEYVLEMGDKAPPDHKLYVPEALKRSGRR